MKPKGYNVGIMPDQHLFLGLYDTRQLQGKMTPTSSKFMMLVDGYLVLSQWLNDPPFAGVVLKLQEGMHKFEIFGDVSMSLDGDPPFYLLKADCVSDFKVDTDVNYYPYIQLTGWAGRTLGIPTCSLIRQVAETDSKE